ncbi:MAG: S1 RNA-binding domain-containing protein, partial [Planctomycetes bacterium]|nr:S1 RNA-binding domain-containing protein [Planctomycetota bacterium]
IIKIDESRMNIVISRRKLLEEGRDKQKSELLSTLEEGQLRVGVVKNIADFGAFVDLGGIDGLLHITDMSWGRISHPSEMLRIDDEVEVKILKFDKDSERIALGLKQKTESPWRKIEERYRPGDRVRGEVVNVMSYGAFVKLEEGVEGLVHISEMSWTRRVNHPSEMVNIGDIVDVVVLNVNASKQEISLGMKQVEENPWTTVEDKYPVGTIIRGRVRNLTNYGAFVEIEEGIDGLLHISDMSWTKKISHPSETVKKGDEVEAIVLSVDQEKKRVALGIKQLTEDPWMTDIPGRYRVGEELEGEVTKITNFGVFVNIGDELEGLMHISELSEAKVENPEEVVQVGDKVLVRIIKVNTEERKIGLSLMEVVERGPGVPTPPAAKESHDDSDAESSDDAVDVVAADASAESEDPEPAGGEDDTGDTEGA